MRVGGVWSARATTCCRRFRPSSLLLDGQAGHCFEDAVNLLDLVDDQRPDRVHIRRLTDRNDVVLACDGVGGGDSAYALHLLGHFERTPGRRVDEDVGLHPSTTPKPESGGTASAYPMGAGGQDLRGFFRVRFSARCWASLRSPGLTATTFGPLTFLSRALTWALSCGETRSRSSAILEIGRDDGSLVDARADDPIAEPALDLEHKLVVADLLQAAGDHHRAARRRGRQLADVDLVADCRLTLGQQLLDHLVTRTLHEADHRGRREDAFATDVHRDQALVDDSLEAVLQPRFETDIGRHWLDCRT